MRGVTTIGAMIGLGLVLSSGAAVAADMPGTRVRLGALTEPGVYDWSGLYVGALGSAASGSSRYDFLPASTSTSQFGLSGGLIGVTAGYNAQAGVAVFGFEGDVNWARITGATDCPGGATRCETNNSWFGTLRGRVGYTVGRILPYVTGGVAGGILEANIPGIGSARATRFGWAAGGGLEFALMGNLSAKAEYLYVNLGRFDCGAACGTPPVRVGFDAHMVRGGVNYRF